MKAPRWLRPWGVVLLLGLAYVALVLVRSGGDPLAFALVGTRYGDGDPQGTPGYDGQFAYFIARDPLSGCPRCDVPAYRYQRILYPLLSWALALGREQLVPWSMIAVNLAALAGGTWVTERLLAAHGVSPWYGLVYGLYGGLVAGLRLDLTEPLAVGLAQASLLAWERKKMSLVAPLLVLAALSKETALVAAAGLVLYLALERRWGAAVRLSLTVGVPFALWQGALWLWLGRPGVGAGGDMATGFELLPLGGLWRVATVSWAAFWLLLAIEGPLFVLPTVWALVVSLREVWRGRSHPWVTVLLTRAAVLLFLPFSTWREPLAMARLSSGLMAALLLYGGLRRSPRVLRWSTIGLATLALVLNESGLPV